MKQQLVEKVIEIMMDRPDLVDVIKIDEGMSYSSIIFRPLKEVKSYDELKAMQMTGFKLYIDQSNDKRKLTVKLFEIEFVSQRGQFPKWQPVSLEPIEQIYIQGLVGPDSNDKVFIQFDNFIETYKTWKEQDDTKKLDDILEEFDNFRTKLTFDDPFQTWLASTIEAEKEKVSSGYADEPEVMDFTRQDKE